MKALPLIYTGFLLLSETTSILAQDYRPEDFLPLAVGNSWTYSHYYYDRLSHPDKEIGEIIERKVITITITHTEQIEGHTYHVFSDMPYDFPPAPYFFLAGKKVRFAEDGRLMEWRPEGEVWTFHFGPDVPDWEPWLPLPEAGYPISYQEDDTLATRDLTRFSGTFTMDFRLLGHPLLVGDHSALLGVGFDELQEDRAATFIWRRGMERAATSVEPQIRTDAPFVVAENNLTNVATHLVEDDTHAGEHSWGQLKQFFIDPSTRGDKDP